MMPEGLTNEQLLKNISALLENARNKVVVAVNQTIVLTYFEIGRMIVEDEQHGESRAEYGKEQLKFLSKNLTKKFGKGFSETNLKQMRQFFLSYSICQTVSDESGSLDTIQQSSLINFNLSWSHYLKLMRIKDPNERSFYEIESYKNNWSLRELQRQYDSALYTRLSLSKNKEEILQLAEKGQIIEKPKDLIKDPYVLEFLGLSEKPDYSENDLESELIDKLEHFLLELGNGFTFVGRQQRITFEEKHFYIDLVFYNRILKCFVLIDLKIGELKHQDIGQMQMYVNYYDREKRLEDENKTIGIILCQDKSEALVQYTLPENNEQIFASKYFTVLPSKQDFINILNSDNGKIS
ncbi:PDDEXK nuclease domain-containing protein [uncultured Chryseobacterium sp.]|uniref:PDDEXK nuclease domain-containing protein n=1 Tax=uncultured Chryseobacterium sp. TaxID=259322 RepID=UPI0025E9727B|nr:PDDEXK nuclease domain-containing protein [uncultured Chryseobacterium sp.]